MRTKTRLLSEYRFVNSLERVFAKDGYSTRREIGAGHGIADLVVAKLNKKRGALRNKYRQRFPLLKESYFKVLQYIPDIEVEDAAVSAEDLHEQTKLSLPFIKYEIIDKLKRHGYIKEVNEKRYLKVNGWAPITDEIVAMEAKLKDWQRGFIQANRYKSFADRVYLVIPEHIGHLPNKDIFRRFRIGLYTYNLETERLRILVPAGKSKEIINEKKNLIAEYFWTQ